MAIQIAAVLICLLCVVLLVSHEDTRLSKLMLVIVICGFVQNAGFLMELQSTSLAEVMSAVRVEYIGSSFIASLLTVFVFGYCKARLPVPIRYLMFLFSAAVFVLVWTYPHNLLYYTGAEFVDTGYFPHVVLDKGPVYVIYAGMIYTELICCGFLSLLTALRAEEKRMRMNCFLLFLSCMVPFAAHLANFAEALEGYDSTPPGVAFGIAVFGIAVARQHIFDVVETAHESILMNLDDAIIIVDQAYGFKEANKKAKELFPVLHDVKYGARVQDMDFNRIFNKDGVRELVIGERFYDIHINQVLYNNKTAGYTAILFDVTENKYQLEKMRELKEQADQANRAKSAFLANVSHEIRTPLNAVLGINEVILRDYEEPQLLEYSRNIHNAAKALLQLINDILDFSKIEAGKFELIAARYHTGNLFSELISAYGFRIKEKGLRFSANIAGNIPKYLIGDAIRIRQVLFNMLSNAVKYTDEGEITMHAVFERTGREMGNLILSVEDTGIGIRKEDMGKLFECFVRLNERNDRTTEGTGLGLNITKQLIDLMNGQLKVTSEYGKGSVFTAVIPQLVSEGTEE
ncbi:MAG TPA: histidine kinase N-terminal 7TM domain-containing protein, partial [Lachnospiraceae bacterium]|nr:histidine kinase N-terminal 7TM domain-containing protein [Lachnospiraceae bacterium]